MTYGDFFAFGVVALFAALFMALSEPSSPNDKSETEF